MVYKYLYPSLLKQILTTQANISNEYKYYIASVGDLMNEIELLKDKELPQDVLDLAKTFCTDNYHNYFHIQEVDRESLLNNLFSKDLDEITICSEINMKTVPHYSINYLALKPIENISFWDDDVLVEMIDVYK